MHRSCGYKSVWFGQTETDGLRDAGHWHVVLLFIDVSSGVCLFEILQLHGHGSCSDSGFSCMNIVFLLLSFLPSSSFKEKLHNSVQLH